MSSRSGWRWLPGLLLAAACAGCPAMAITTASIKAASATADDRSYEQQLADTERKAEIEKQLLVNDASLAAKVDVDVYLGRVMLTGVVPDEASRRTAVELVRDEVGGATVYDDIQVVPGGSSEGGGFVANEELGARLLKAEGLGSQSFQHRVVNGTAYILGEARLEEQVETARKTALGTPGVEDVVTHIVVRP
ncbi:MAG: BON domain-containing protein [Thermodesulfobacteriota bacterium]